MNEHKLRQITIKKAQILMDRDIGDAARLEQMQMKVARGLPMLVDNQEYLDGLVLENMTDEEIQAIVKDVESAKLEKSEIVEREMFHCICCGNIAKSLDGGGMCTYCYLQYNMKISQFLTKPTGGGIPFGF